MAGRPKAFDREAALARAMELFWVQGYQASGLKDLLDHMGIGRQSLYDTYGSKRDLFVEALRAYVQVNVTLHRDILDTPGAPMENIDRVLNFWKWAATQEDARGCMLNNSIIELRRADDEAAQVVNSHVQQIEDALRDTLARAAKAGDLPPEADTRTLARFLVHTAHGLFVMGKAGVEEAYLDDIIRVARAALTTGG